MLRRQSYARFFPLRYCIRAGYAQQLRFRLSSQPHLTTEGEPVSLQN